MGAPTMKNKDKHTCFVCGQPATTQEHIFPKWLQNKFDLWDQTIGLPNETTIPYRQLKIHCCNPCNNEIMSKIETKIKEGTASNDEIWKWGAKIHFGLLRKDDFMEWDRKNPGCKIGDVVRPNDPLELDRHLVHSIHGEFNTHPSPFGSVYKFIFAQEEEPYHFVHLINPAGICISLGDVGYVIFIKDGGSLDRQPSVRGSYHEHLEKCHLGKMLNFFANAWAHLYRHRVSTPFMMSKNTLAILGRGKLIEERHFTEEMYHKLWRYVSSNSDAPLVSIEEYRATNGIAKDHSS